MKDHEHMSLWDKPFILLLICRGLRKSSFQIWQMVSKVHAVKFGQTLIDEFCGFYLFLLPKKDFSTLQDLK